MNPPRGTPSLHWKTPAHGPPESEGLAFPPNQMGKLSRHTRFAQEVSSFQQPIMMDSP